MYKYKNTFLELDSLDSKKFPYQPTFDFPGPFINRSHEYYSNCPLQDNGESISIGIRGGLSRVDALKLYEIAYFVHGDVLELGSSRGLSALVLLNAIKDSGTNRALYSVDIKPECIELTRKNIDHLGLDHLFQICDDAGRAISQLAKKGKKFDFVFIDHSHAYKPVFDVCQELPKVLNPQAFCLFHDFNTKRNADPANEDYKVYQALRDGLSPDFEFYGIFRSAALYRFEPKC